MDDFCNDVQLIDLLNLKDSFAAPCILTSTIQIIHFGKE